MAGACRSTSRPIRKLLYGEGEEKRAKETEIKKRLLYVQAVDTARCLEANVLTDPQDGDVGSIMGLGFAPQTGGAISLIDQVGVKQFVAECDELAKKYGPQFEVPKLLRDMAAKGQSFYGKAARPRRPDIAADWPQSAC